MKALSLVQPWATLVAIGAKRIETRSWRTTYRGPLAIHASGTIPPEGYEAMCSDPVRRILDANHYVASQTLPLGAIVAVARLTDIVRTDHERVFEKAGAQASIEKQLGNYDSGRWAWILEDVRRIFLPLHCKGALHLWTVDGLLLEELEERLGARA